MEAAQAKQELPSNSRRPLVNPSLSVEPESSPARPRHRSSKLSAHAFLLKIKPPPLVVTQRLLAVLSTWLSVPLTLSQPHQQILVKKVGIETQVWKELRLRTSADPRHPTASVEGGSAQREVVGGGEQPEHPNLGATRTPKPW